jgi:hypothetical protein
LNTFDTLPHPRPRPALAVAIMEIACQEVCEDWDVDKLRRAADRMERWAVQMRFRAEMMERENSREAKN